MSLPLCVSQVKLLGIDASGIADGIPSVVLNLIWNVILYFQVGLSQSAITLMSIISLLAQIFVFVTDLTYDLLFNSNTG